MFSKDNFHQTSFGDFFSPIVGYICSEVTVEPLAYCHKNCSKLISHLTFTRDLSFEGRKDQNVVDMIVY